MTMQLNLSAAQITATPLHYDFFWGTVAPKMKAMKLPMTKEGAHKALNQIRRETHQEADRIERERLATVNMFHNCRLVERDAALLIDLPPPAPVKKKKSRCK